MGIRLEDEKRLPTEALSTAQMLPSVPAALALLKRTNNMDLVPALGLESYVE